MTTMEGRTVASRPRRRVPISNFWAKTTMAVTGLIFAAFVFVHMYGNLHIYYGAAAFDEYAHWLRTLLEPLLPYSGLLWILRVVLLVCLLLHVGAALLLHARSRRARGSHRRRGMRRIETWLARSMMVSGVVILLFVIFHILDLTIGAQPVATDTFAHGAAYANLVASFSRPAVAGFYILAMLVLTAHVAHGIWAAAHDLGATGRRLRQVAVVLAGAVALAICLGNISIPVMVLAGGLR